MDVLQESIGRLLPSPRQMINVLQLPLILSGLWPDDHHHHHHRHHHQQHPQTPADQTQVTVQEPPTCPPTTDISCPKTTPTDTCCTNHPSGHFLLAQFWDAQPALGPEDSWTLHGLWPDRCTGGYDANCDFTREMTPTKISDVVRDGEADESLTAYMSTYWKGLHGDDAGLWAHEWNKHGTCVSTLESRCYSHHPSSSSDNHRDLLDYFTAATTLHATLDTHGLLAAAGITPSDTARYTLAEIEAALSLSQHPLWNTAESSATSTATIKCHAGALNEVWMHFGTRGSLRNTTSGNVLDKFVPVPPDGRGNCPASGIRYSPKHAYNKPGPTHTYTPGPEPTGRNPSFEGRGFLRVRTLEGTESRTAEGGEGCLIRQGGWYTSGQCATYRATPDIISSRDGDDNDDDNERLFTLASSYAPCAILDARNGKSSTHGQFVCGQRLPVQSIFGVGSRSDEIGDGGESVDVLKWRNQTVFYAAKVPRRFEKVPVFTDDGDGEREVKLEIYWQGV